MLRTSTSRGAVPSLHDEPVRQHLKAAAKLWLRRSRTRRALATLNDQQLRDIGLTRDDVSQEVARPFWSPWLRP